MRMGIGLSLKCGRSGSWTPAQLTSLAAWYEAAPAYCWQDVGCTVACGDGDPIYTWQDRSGNGYHLTQSDILKRPTLRLVSGKWAVLFDGVNDYLERETTPALSAPISLGNISSYTWARAYQGLICGLSNDNIALNYYNGYLQYYVVPHNISPSIGGYPQPAGCCIGRTSTTRSQVFYNGANLATSSTATTTAAATGIRLGALGNPYPGECHSGYIYNAFICLADLTDSEIEKYTNYSRINYGTP